MSAIARRPEWIAAALFVLALVIANRGVPELSLIHI